MCLHIDSKTLFILYISGRSDSYDSGIYVRTADIFSFSLRISCFLFLFSSFECPRVDFNFVFCDYTGVLVSTAVFVFLSILSSLSRA